VTVLRQVEVLMAQGKATPEACREAGISQQSYYRWCKEYGGLEIDQAKRMKNLERENVRLKRLVADCVVSWSTGPNMSAGCGDVTGVTPLALYRAWIVDEARKLGSPLPP